MPEPGESSQEARRGGVAYDSVGLLTIPNALTAARLVGAGSLVVLAYFAEARWFIGVFVVLLFTDWLDGKLAILLHQRSALGARLDSLGDAWLALCLTGGVALLEPGFFGSAAPLIATAIGLYAVSLVVSLVRLGGPPAYHTYAAKVSWWLIAIGTVVLVAGGPAWLLWTALVCVVVTNVEGLILSSTLGSRDTDIRSLWHAKRPAQRG